MSVRRGALAVVVLLAGCSVSHAIVLREGAPLHAGPTDDAVIARLPRHFHQPLQDEPDDDAARIPLVFGDRAGWADRADLRVIEYLDPDLDDGEDRDRTVRRELRELLLADQGRGWPPTIVEAIREERVVAGMTRPQVELAWGWPLTVEPLAPGERWVYRAPGTVPVRRWVDGPWLDGGVWFHPWGVGPMYRYRDYDWRWTPTWVTVQLPVTVERVVEFDEAGRVVGVHTRRLLDEES